MTQQLNTPSLQGLWQHSVISIREGVIYDFPSFLLTDPLLIYQYSE